MDDHAQEEIRAYATVIGEEIIAKWVPFVWEAFRDYRKDSVIYPGRKRRSSPYWYREIATRPAMLPFSLDC
jgi:thymidylate synthase ThyX